MGKVETMGRDAVEAPTRQLAAAVAAVREAQLPASTLLAARHVVLDTIGCMLGAAGTREAEAVRSLVALNGGSGPCSVVAGGARTGAIDAAYANALLAHVLELDDTHRAAIMHPASPIIAAAMAAAELVAADGEAFLRGVIGGYEAGVRAAVAIQPTHWYKGYLSMGTCGAVGAAAAAGLIFGFDDDAIAQAMGLAGIQAGGLNVSIFASGDMGKLTTPAAGAANGLRAAMLVKAGLTGPTTILEGRFGLFDVWSDDAAPAIAFEGLGERYEIEQTGLKPYSCCRYIHGPLQLLDEIVAEEELGMADIASVEVRTYEAAVIDRPHRSRPLTLFDAKMSLPYCLAVQLETGTFGEEPMEQGLARLDTLAPIADRIRVVADAEMTPRFPASWPASVAVTTTGGRRFDKALDYPKGEPENPLSEDEIVAKFRMLAAAHPAAGDPAALAAELLAIDSVSAVAPLFDRLARSA